MNNVLSLNTTAARIQSVDLLRGLVMVLMAIDHVRVYSGLPAGGPEVGIFFTRWITHFCAPAFAFFAGTSAFLYGAKINDKAKLSRFLITRGLILVVLELTLIRFFWAFHVGTDFILAGVIWMLGWCMVLLSAMVWLKPVIIAGIGILIIVFQPLFSQVPQVFNNQETFVKLWEFIYPSGFETFNGVSVLYSIVPWIGVMATGYGFGALLLGNDQFKRRWCLLIGISAIALFLIIGSIQIIFTNVEEDSLPFVLELLNQRKYPASTLFLMMTLGPVIALIPFADKARGRIYNAMTIIGRVPFFYYLVHILLIHISALAVQLIIHGDIHHEWFTYAPYVFIENEFRWSLWLLYAVFVVDTAILYFICRWYATYKSNHPERKWLKYL